jgi:acyl-CoA thioester hydrolase
VIEGAGRASLLPAWTPAAIGVSLLRSSASPRAEVPPLSHRPAPLPRSSFRHFLAIPTRWADNDAYAHVNNVVYYSYFDTVVNEYLISRGALDIERSNVIGIVVETHCNFFAPVKFPQRLDAGLRVTHIGGSSVRYEIGMFVAGADVSAAVGHFVHVYVNRNTRRPVVLPQALRIALEDLRT